ncbi:hypothetical protein QY049_03510 [Bradyrhizobium sp. WYCCWR 13022]|uniref:hypothetical protein n=1 Tax=unclassified Bradyrhizobium TaxID=2631580 RepID=UPI00263A71C2|nr:hypothetical protein [Bradyrhizobium sp. WYCCWR 13022]MDN4982290.1 hypothetical protein [Bradyrhizobium sp. WYCCWR 13022]
MQAIAELRPESVRATSPGLAAQERSREKALRRLRRLRKWASAEIERLLAFLDQSDEYVQTELEDDISADLEEVGDDEPSLGSPDRLTEQFRWAGSGGSSRDTIDCEPDHADDEPSLGWAEEEPAHGCYVGVTPSTVDVEEQCEDEGVSV